MRLKENIKKFKVSYEFVLHLLLLRFCITDDIKNLKLHILLKSLIYSSFIVVYRVKTKIKIIF